MDIPLSAYATIMLYPYRRNLIWSHLCLISTLSHRETHLTLGGSRVLSFYPWWDHRTSCAEGIVWNRSNRFGVGPQCHSCPSIFAQFLLLRKRKDEFEEGRNIYETNNINSCVSVSQSRSDTCDSYKGTHFCSLQQCCGMQN